MSEARKAYLEYEITNGLNPKIHNYVKELEQLLKECIVDKDILRYNNMELEQQKSELIKCLESAISQLLDAGYDFQYGKELLEELKEKQ